MIGAIIGDIVGSRFEWNNIKSRDFAFFHEDCHFTDDSVMTLAIGEALLESTQCDIPLNTLAVQKMQEYGRRYRRAGYGGLFRRWLKASSPQPYGSFGNGSAMRVSAVGHVANSPEQLKELSFRVTAVTHDHAEGLKGAEATAMAIYLARTGSSPEQIREHICQHYYAIDFTLDSIRPTYTFDATCQGSVPQALQCFFESTGFEDCIRNAISLGGDCDTTAAIAGSVAAACYGVPGHLRNKALTYLDDDQRALLARFEAAYPNASGRR